ncbi:transposase [Hoeflea prorocentri]|uniref:Transposase n=1 Tax=Hoeflea prorocentri TaxID=1922333 RepID=A0A9X3UK45_9HYPH|nr:transposase [Hoeflea prorocentri]MCY6381890.1 transposase [Hoeflea prorocentri]MDA5399690.1 transposase [Hoeflea prorocentri]
MCGRPVFVEREPDGSDTSAFSAGPQSRRVEVPHDKELYRQRHKIENMFARLKDWWRIATRHDRCAHFFCAICITATVTFWL